MSVRVLHPQTREISVVVQDFTITGDLVYSHAGACWSDIEDVYLTSKGVAMYVDDPEKMGALVDGEWVSFRAMLLKEACS